MTGTTSAPASARGRAAVVVFCRSPLEDARRWGWGGGAGGAGVDARKSLLNLTLRKVARVRDWADGGARVDVLVFHRGAMDPVPGAGFMAEQRGRDFAERLQDAVSRTLARGYDRVVV